MTPGDLGNEGTKDVVLVIAGLLFVIKLLIEFIMKLIPKTTVLTEADVRQGRYMENMMGHSKSIEKLLEGLTQKQGQTNTSVNDIHNTQKNIKEIQDKTHFRTGEIQTSVQVLETVFTRDTMKDSAKRALEDSTDMLKGIFADSLKGVQISKQ